MDKEASAKRMSHVISGLEKALTMCSFDRMAYAQKLVSADPFKSQIDRESEKRIRQISPDFILADHALHMPAMLNTGIPYGFVQSCNPLAFDLEEFPILGSDCRTDDKEAIRECRKRYAELHRPEVMRNYENILKERGAEYRGAMRVNQMISEQHFSVYCFPEPLDYFDEETKRRYNLWQIDSPLFEERIPKPYELPEEFKQIPLPLIFVRRVQSIAFVNRELSICQIFKIKKEHLNFSLQSWYDVLCLRISVAAAARHVGKAAL